MFIIDFILHIEDYIHVVINNNVLLTYILLFGIIFVETGLVIMPFLPGDSVLFAAGAIVASTHLISLPLLYVLLLAAAILGDSLNYLIGHFVGEKITKKHPRWLNKEYMDRTEAFFEKHGVQAITIARFVPIVRTFAPFVAGVSKMDYRLFIKYNIIGGFIWITSMLGLGYFFGNLPIIQENFSFVLIAIIIISFIPVMVTYIKERNEAKKKGVK